MNNRLFSIIIPLYNEKGNIISLLERFYYFNNEYNFELILVNDCSNDGSKEVLENLDSKYKGFTKIITNKENKGYGGSILAGLEISQGDLLGWMHSDLQTDVKYIFEAYDLYKSYGDSSKILFKGHRKDRKLSQIVFSYFMSLLCSITFLMNLVEINAQPKLFSRKLYSCFTNPPKDFSLDLYLLILAKKNGYSFKSIDVNYIDRKYGESKWSFSFKSKFNTIIRTIRYIFQLRFGITNKCIKK